MLYMIISVDLYVIWVYFYLCIRSDNYSYMEEQWKNISGYEDLYQVSNYGRVRKTNGKNNYLTPYCRSDGYEQVVLCKNSKTKTIRIHRLVAQAFIPNPSNLPEINHKDENKLNNNVDNLEWCDSSYNKNYRNSKH